MKTKALYLTVVLGMMLGFSSCNLDTFPSDELSSDLLLKDPKGAEYIMDGCYAYLKDEVDFLGYSSGNCYVRHYFQLAEFPGDNICLCASSTDPLYEATALRTNDGLKNIGTLWMTGYKVIYMCNTVIATLKEDDPANSQLLGEAYFLRGLLHLHLVTLYAKPYVFGRDNLGVPLRISVSSEVQERAPVGEVYDQIVKDLRKAADMLGKSRGNAGYPCKEAALGILSRVYLYMGLNDECIAAVNEALNGADPDSKLEHGADYTNYFINAKTSKETLFCLAHETTDDRKGSSIGSMYNNDGGGWGEVFPSDPLMILYERYPSDLRLTSFIKPQYKAGSTRTIGYFVDPSTIPDDNGTIRHTPAAVLTAKADGSYTFTEDGTTYDVEKRKVNGEGEADPAGEYYEYHVNYAGVDCEVLVSPELEFNYKGKTFPNIFMTKFGYQDGIPTLSSPVFCRWAELILNRAEANAKLGNAKEALDDVNIIRARAGIPADFSPANMHGYSNALNVVLDERRMELAFEGHRVFDVYRNELNMDRRYPGAQVWEIVDPRTEPHIIYPIPNNEWTVSGIQQNDGY